MIAGTLENPDSGHVRAAAENAGIHVGRGAVVKNAGTSLRVVAGHHATGSDFVRFVRSSHSSLGVFGERGSETRIISSCLVIHRRRLYLCSYSRWFVAENKISGCRGRILFAVILYFAALSAVAPLLHAYNSLLTNKYLTGDSGARRNRRPGASLSDPLPIKDHRRAEPGRVFTHHCRRICKEAVGSARRGRTTARSGRQDRRRETVLPSAPADGYTLLFATPTYTLNTAMGVCRHTISMKDFTPVAHGGTHFLRARCPIRACLPNPLRNSSPMPNQNPGKLNCASAGIGTVPHIACAYLNKVAGTEYRACPSYKDVNSGMMATVANVTQMFFGVATNAKPQIDSGRCAGLRSARPSARCCCRNCRP